MTELCFVVAQALPSVELIQQERYAMMKAGVSYMDWSRMARFQRMDFMARRTLEMAKLETQMKKADGASGIVGVILGKLLGF